MSFAPPESSEDTSLHHSEPELESGAPPARARNEFPAAPALPEIPALELPALTPPASSHFEHSPWPLGVADAAAEFAALKANAAAPARVEEPPAEQPSSPQAVAPVPVQAEATPALPPESAVSAPEPTAFPEVEEQRAAYDPFPVSFEQRSVTVVDAPEPESAPAPSYEPPAVVWSPNPAPVAAQEPVLAAAAAPAPAAESDVSERVSVEWVPDQVAGVPSPQPQPDGGGYIERYQRLFSGDSVDPQQAILAALDAAIQAPSSDSTAVASVATEVAVQAAAAPAPATVAAAVPAPQATSEAPAASSDSALKAAAHPAGPDAPTGAAKLNLTRDVDWSEDVLATAARAAAVAAERARAQQLQAQADAALVSSQRVAAGLSPQSRRDGSSAHVRAEARPLSTPVPSVQAEAPASERGARQKARKQQARRARFVATPLFLFAFVGSVIFALGVGFVSGFMIGKETGKSAEQTPPRPAEPAALAAAGPAAEPAASAAEGANARKKAGLNSRVEGVVPGANPAGGPEPGASAAGASAAANAKYLRGPFDSKLAGNALSKAAAGAGICVPPGDAGGEAVVTVTLDPSGVTSNAAVYGARFAGTQAGECIVGLLRGIKVRPFTGDPVTVKKTIQVN